MDEDDDLYSGTGDDAQTTEHESAIKAEDEVETNGHEEEEEDEDSDDDVQFTLEKPEGAQSSTPAAQPKKQEPNLKRARSGTPIKTESQQQQRSSSTAPPSQQQQQPPATKAALTHAGKEGKDFPAIHSSTLAVNATPLWPDSHGKPITEVDIDADLAEHSKPWRLPGTDQTDFFNYGFDEFTWAQYAIRQQTMVGTIQEQKKQDEAMKAMFGGGPGPGGMGGGPGGGGGPMPGMPSEQEMMQMLASGMNEEQFMQQMIGRGGMMGGPPQGPQGGNFGGPGPGGFGGPQGPGGFGGGPRVPTGSPHPQGQGFQPPTGPAGQGGQDGFGGMGNAPNMEGYSPQQMAIMQQQQGGGRGRGRGRGRGYY